MQRRAAAAGQSPALRGRVEPGSTRLPGGAAKSNSGRAEPGATGSGRVEPGSTRLLLAVLREQQRPGRARRYGAGRVEPGSTRLLLAMQREQQRPGRARRYGVARRAGFYPAALGGAAKSNSGRAEPGATGVASGTRRRGIRQPSSPIRRAPGWQECNSPRPATGVRRAEADRSGQAAGSPLRAVALIDRLGGPRFGGAHDRGQRRTAQGKHPVHVVRHDHPGHGWRATFMIRRLHPADHFIRVGSDGEEALATCGDRGHDVAVPLAGESSTLQCGAGQGGIVRQSSALSQRRYRAGM